MLGGSETEPCPPGVREHEQEEPLQAGDFIRPGTMLYRVERVVPLSVDESDEFDARVEAVWAAGPAQAGFG